jgi:hypothetical protein
VLQKLVSKILGHASLKSGGCVATLINNWTISRHSRHKCLRQHCNYVLKGTSTEHHQSVNRGSTEGHQSGNRASTERQQSVNRASTERQQSVNRPSTEHQQRVNRTSTIFDPVSWTI